MDIKKYLPESIKHTMGHSFLYRLYLRRILKRDATAFPYATTIELTNRCNLSCRICPLPKMRNKAIDMDFELFKKVVDEIAKFADKKTSFTPVGLGEPLMYAELPEAIEYMKAKCPDAPINFNTNGTLLDKEKAEMLCKSLGGSDRLLISLNAGDRSVYEWLMGKDKFDLVVNNIKDFLATRKKFGNGPKIVVQLLEAKKTESEVEKFRNFWNPLLGQNDSVYVRPLLNWGGTVDIKDIQICEKGDRYPCYSLWIALVIDEVGNVYPCCEAFSKRDTSELLLGNIQEKSLTEIFSGNRIQDIRKKHLNKQWNEISECSNCDFWSFYQNIWFKIGKRWF